MEFPQRKSTRLSGYDYSRPALYFVTICLADWNPILGRIVDVTCSLSEIGTIVSDTWMKIPDKFPDVFLDEYIVMPDHLHGILAIEQNLEREISHTVSGGRGSPPLPGVSLPQILRWYKSITTHLYHEKLGITGEDRKQYHLWQRSYYDRIIRSERDLNEKRLYIQSNPQRWSFKHSNE